jgi:CubicO group peptidase (beta-lactamase class C family)
VEYQLAVQRVPGASTGVVHDQEVLSMRGYGLANPDTQTAATPDTVFSICSISKLFTSVTLMQLRDEGLVSLDQPVAEYLDWFAIQDAHPDDEEITVRNILSHSSGLPRESDYPYWSNPDFVFPTRQEVMERIDEQATLYPASRYYQYSNLGLTLAGEIVTAVSGQDFHERVRDVVLEPLGMTSTFSDIPAQEWGKRLALGFSELGRDGTRRSLPLFEANGIAPAAGFASSTADMTRFAAWQFRLLGGGDREILRGSTLREMQRVQWIGHDWGTARGLGFGVYRVNGETYVGHGGACPGYYSRFLLEPKTKVGLIVLTNAIGSPTDLFTERGHELLGPAIQQAKDDPDDLPQRDPDLDRYVGVYDSAWGQTAILRWKDGLATLWLGTRNPQANLTELKKTGEHTFRRVRKDDDSLGEEFFFEVDENGEVTRFRQHSNWEDKVR